MPCEQCKQTRGGICQQCQNEALWALPHREMPSTPKAEREECARHQVAMDWLREPIRKNPAIGMDECF